MPKHDDHLWHTPEGVGTSSDLVRFLMNFDCAGQTAAMPVRDPWLEPVRRRSRNICEQRMPGVTWKRRHCFLRRPQLAGGDATGWAYATGWVYIHERLEPADASPKMGI